MNDKSKRINVRFNETDYDAISAFATKYGKSRSEVVRMMVDSTFAKISDLSLDEDKYKEKLRAINDLKTEFSNLSTQLKKIGNNINQIARKVNAGEAEEPENISACRKMLVKMLNITHSSMKNILSR